MNTVGILVSFIEFFLKDIEPVKNTVLLTAFFSICLAPSSAYSQPFDCSVVADERLFNLQDLEVSERLIANLKSDICNKTWDSYEHVTSSTRSGGWNLDVFDLFDNSLVDNKSGSTGVYDVSRTEFCKNSVEQTARSFGSDYRSVNGRFALQAFERCLELQPRDETYLEYEILGQARNQIFRGDLKRTWDGTGGFPEYEIQGLSTTPLDAEIECTILSKDIPDDLSEENPIVVRATPAGVSCSKTDERDAFLEIQTSEGQFPIFIPSKETIEEQRMDQLERQIALLSDTVNAPSTVPVYKRISGSDLDHTFELTIDFNAILFASGTAIGSYKEGGGVNAGTRITAYINGGTCGADRSFEGNSFNISFHASASCIAEVKPGVHKVRFVVNPTSTSGNSLRANVVAIPID